MTRRNVVARGVCESEKNGTDRDVFPGRFRPARARVGAALFLRIHADGSRKRKFAWSWSEPVGRSLSALASRGM
jgi:hypothetical protein